MAFWRPEVPPGRHQVARKAAPSDAARDTALAARPSGWRAPRRGWPRPPLGPARRRSLPARRCLLRASGASAGAHGASRRRRCAPSPETDGPRDVPLPRDSRPLTLEPGSSSASSSSSSRRRAGMARTPSRLPAQPAGSGGRCGRAEDGAGAPRGQRGGGGSSAKEELTRRRRHPHSRPFKRRAGASSGRGGSWLGAGPRLGGAISGAEPGASVGVAGTVGGAEVSAASGRLAWLDSTRPRAVGLRGGELVRVRGKAGSLAGASPQEVGGTAHPSERLLESDLIRGKLGARRCPLPRAPASSSRRGGTTRALRGGARGSS